MDVREIKYPDNYFDFAIDKSTIDALLCGERSFVNVALMMKEVQRVLKEDGVYMIISYGQPENRIFHLEREHLNFDINIYTIKKDYSVEEDAQKYEKMHYVYICKKRKEADEISKLNFTKVIADLEAEEKMEEDYYKIKSNIYSKKNEKDDEEIEEEENYDDDHLDSESENDNVQDDSSSDVDNLAGEKLIEKNDKDFYSNEINV
jgi:ubiquinone/menaquinone biosynthesis C-methylase UbiE